MNFDIELSLKEKGFNLIGGIDEAGRGPLAGPVSAACVILDENHIPQGINDSKKLSEKKREAIYEEIMATADVSCIMLDQKIIDKINILEATKEAMRLAVEGLKQKPDFLIIDGNFVIGAIKDEMSIVGGDAKSLSIGAASIVAKVTRDRYMKKIDEEYPMYGFKKHKGYGTKEHIEKIREFGPCPYHRASFLKKIL